MNRFRQHARLAIPWLPILAVAMMWAAYFVLLYSMDEAVRPSWGSWLGVALVVLGGGLLAWFVQRHLRKLREGALAENATRDAGRWVTRVAFAKHPDRARLVQAHPWLASLDSSPATPIQKELDRWFAEMKSGLMDQAQVMSQEMERDLQLATEFQQAFLNRAYPEVPSVYIDGRLRLEFNHVYRPAMAVGGDFFDLIAIGTDCAGLFITDVMGHGVRSALITAILRALIAELTPQARNAPYFMEHLNKEFCDILQTMPSTNFASAFYFVADTTSRIATYANAGHLPPYLLNRSRAKVGKMSLPQPKSVALGLLDTEKFSGETVRLHDGQTFLFYTDGLYECTNPDGEEFGLHRVEKVLQQNIYKSTGEILKAVVVAVNEFVRGEPLADDLCMVAIDVTTSPPKNGV